MGTRVKLALAAQLVGRHDRVVRWHIIEKHDLPAVKADDGRTWLIDVDDLERVPGWRVDPLRLAQLTHASAPSAAPGDASGAIAAEVLARHVAELEAELRAMRARLALLEGRSAASPRVSVAPPRSAEASPAPNLTPSGASADYHSLPVIPYNREIVQHRQGRREPERATASDPPLPEGWRAAVDFLSSYGVPLTTARRWVEGIDKHGRAVRERKVPEPHHGAWASGGPGTFLIRHAYDPAQLREVAEILRGEGRTPAAESPRKPAETLAEPGADD